MWNICRVGTWKVYLGCLALVAINPSRSSHCFTITTLAKIQLCNLFLCYYSVLLLCSATLCCYFVLLLCAATLFWYFVLLLCAATLCCYSVLLLCSATLFCYSVLLLCAATLCCYSVLHYYLRVERNTTIKAKSS